jgi:GT2 family glycosyltransferase
MRTHEHLAVCRRRHQRGDHRVLAERQTESGGGASAPGPARLTIVIVSYNCYNLLQDCLLSIQNSREEIGFDVYVVDNCSSDQTCDRLRERFPWVTLIAADCNLGFARANNRAIRETDSEYILLLNPDTVISSGVLSDAVRFLDSHRDAGMMTCKLLTADGSLDVACRRSFPTVFDGFCRAAGLSRAFPQSRTFARYNLTYLDDREAAEVDAISGAFMMVRRAAVREVGALDEDYFMYGEDLDWAFRFRKAGWKIHYVPDNTVVHLGGGSSRSVSDRMIREFFRSMRLFVHKRYAPEQPRLVTSLTVLSIWLWMQVVLIKNMFRRNKMVRP